MRASKAPNTIVSTISDTSVLLQGADATRSEVTGTGQPSQYGASSANQGTTNAATTTTTTNNGKITPQCTGIWKAHCMHAAQQALLSTAAAVIHWQLGTNEEAWQGACLQLSTSAQPPYGCACHMNAVLFELLAKSCYFYDVTAFRPYVSPPPPDQTRTIGKFSGSREAHKVFYKFPHLCAQAKGSPRARLLRLLPRLR